MTRRTMNRLATTCADGGRLRRLSEIVGIKFMLIYRRPVADGERVATRLLIPLWLRYLPTTAAVLGKNRTRRARLARTCSTRSTSRAQNMSPRPSNLSVQTTSASSSETPGTSMTRPFLQPLPFFVFLTPSLTCSGSQLPRQIVRPLLSRPLDAPSRHALAAHLFRRNLPRPRHQALRRGPGSRPPRLRRAAQPHCPHRQLPLRRNRGGLHPGRRPLGPFVQIWTCG